MKEENIQCEVKAFQAEERARTTVIGDGGEGASERARGVEVRRRAEGVLTSVPNFGFIPSVRGTQRNILARYGCVLIDLSGCK